MKEGHASIKDSPARIPAILNMCQDQDILENQNTIFLNKERLASKSEIFKVHSRDYYEKVQKWTKKAGDIKAHLRDAWSGQLYDWGAGPECLWKGVWVNKSTLASARYAVGGVLDMKDCGVLQT